MMAVMRFYLLLGEQFTNVSLYKYIPTVPPSVTNTRLYILSCRLFSFRRNPY